MKSYVYFNPFVKYSEQKLLIAGLVLALVGSLLAFFLGVVFDGVLDLHLGEYSVAQTISFNFLQIATMTVFLFTAAFIINTKTRFVDILNVAFFYRIPFYVSTFFITIPAFRNILQSITHPDDIYKISGGDMIVLVSVSLVSFLLLIWAMVILVNGFRVGSNAKKTWHFILLTVAVLLAEGFSKYLFLKISS